MLIAALFTVARSWKQPKCPSTDECIKKLWYIYTMEYYSAIRWIEIESFVESWMELKTVIQSEVSQKEEKQILYINAYMWKQPKCPLTDEWIKKMWHIYTMEYYSAIKRNETGSFVEM